MPAGNLLSVSSSWQYAAAAPGPREWDSIINRSSISSTSRGIRIPWRYRRLLVAMMNRALAGATESTGTLPDRGHGS